MMTIMYHCIVNVKCREESPVARSFDGLMYKAGLMYPGIKSDWSEPIESISIDVIPSLDGNTW